MKKFKSLHEIGLKDYDNYIFFSVIGIFETNDIHWEYRVITHNKTKTSDVSKLTEDICSKEITSPTISDVLKYGKVVDTLEDGIAYLSKFKLIWESGNNSKQEMRNMVIDNILEQK